MGANESEFEKIVNKLNIDDKPSTQHKDKLRWRMLAEFNAHGEDEKTASDGFHNKWRTIMNSKIAKLTVAAAIIIAALIGFSMLTGEDKEREEEIVKKQKVIQEINPDQIDGRDDKVVADADRLKAEKLAAQMDLVEKLYAAGNTKGLVAMLKVGRRQSKIAAANYLAKLGDDSALAPLQQLSEQWKGDPEENPFAVAAEKISRQLEQDKEELGQPGQKDVQIVQQNQDNIQVTPTIIVEKPVVAENTVTYSGVIKNEASEPIARASVRSSSHNENLQFNPHEAQTTTDDNGMFTIGPLKTVDGEKQERRLIFEHPDYAIGWADVDHRRNLDPTAMQITLLAPDTVAGTVLDEQGYPIEGAMVEASLQLVLDRNYYYFNMWRFNEMFVTTDTQGRFVLDRVPEKARLHLDISCKGYGLYSTQLEYKNTSMYPIRAGEDDIMITLKPGGFIRGRLVMNNKPYETTGVTIVVRGENGNTIVPTDEKGKFETTGLAQGSYTVQAIGGDFENKGLICKTLTDVYVEVSDTGTEVELLVQKTLPLKVRVVNNETAKAIEDVWVRAGIGEGKRSPTAASGKTDADGISVLKLSPGEYSIKVQGWKNGRLHDFSRTVTVASDSKDLVIEIAISSRQGIWGWLMDADGKAIEGTVSLDSEKPVSADNNGEFVLNEPFDRGMDFHVGYAFDKAKKIGKGFLWQKTDDANDLELVLEPLAAIKGRMVDANGKEISDAKLELWVAMPYGGSRGGSANNPWKRTIKTDGSFIFESVPVGLTMKVFAEKPGFQGNAVVEGLTPGKTINVGDVILKPLHGFEGAHIEWTRILKGRIVDENGKPMAALRVYASVGMVRFEDTTDRKGRYQLKDLPQGKSIRVGVYAPGYGHCSARSDEVSDVLDIQIFPQGWGLFGKPAPGLFVEKWLNTEPVTLDQYHGKVVLLQIAAMISGHNYLSGLDELTSLYEKYNDKGLEIIIIHHRLPLGWLPEVTETEIADYMKKHGVEFPVAMDDKAIKVRDMVPEDRLSNGAMYALYDVKATPAIYLIDKEGKVRISPKRDEIEKWVKRLLRE